MEKDKRTFRDWLNSVVLSIFAALVVGTLIFGSYIFVRNMIRLIMK